MSSRSRSPAFVCVVVVATALGLVGCAPETAPTRSSSATPAAPQAPTASPSPTGFDKTALPIDDPASIWVVVNKLRALQPSSYVPADLIATPVPHLNPPHLRSEAASAMAAMFAAAKAEGAGGMQLQSASRSYGVQVNVYNGYVSRSGEDGADAQSARPGHSEHQTGLAADISALPLTCALAACFGQTPQGRWLAANAYRFGFLLRYPADKTAITGYMYEPWHFRYIGLPLATEMHATGVTTLEEFFGLPPAPDYSS
ncbi:D-alanyl-D-alanine carboxypeptidase family protein [Lacisediminihabitans profunda]|uniref:M15 family metallopeptidase n=1 Tax=Lacisediminihabitans profunda TaxID=2594790 RepID=A0A5C8UMM0_9MICO|nr:D-alanyl-D-alanine carboxypeptidase family protein [Lacisediminihabitans profunda]TXN29450.1 M15 family metallopeptidase [Lacisediminihabitans profunda]